MRVAIVGGGLAGLAAACDLADGGHQVTVYEKRPFAGGKTYSFADRETGEQVDNGQHVFMACTTEYTDFLRKLGTLGLTRRQKRLSVPVFDERGRRSVLRSTGMPAPLHLGWSFLHYRHVPNRDKPGIVRILLAASRMSESERLALHDISLGEWLRDHGQSERQVSGFWDFMLVPTINVRAGEVSAADALFVLRHGFLHSNSAAAIGVSRVGLSELHVKPAEAYIRARGGHVETSAEVSAVCADPRGVQGIALADGRSAPVDAVVIATPHAKVQALLPGEIRFTEPFASACKVRSAPIVNLHMWYDRPVAEFAFAAFVGNELQWVFNRDRLDVEATPGRHHLAISLSAAGEYMALSRKQLENRFLPQVLAALPATRRAKLLKFQAMKEPEATFIPEPGLRRPSNATAVPGLFLAGAYTDTGWPATMESAVRSGRRAAALVASSVTTAREPVLAGPSKR